MKHELVEWLCIELNIWHGYGFEPW